MDLANLKLIFTAIIFCFTIPLQAGCGPEARQLFGTKKSNPIPMVAILEGVWRVLLNYLKQEKLGRLCDCRGTETGDIPKRLTILRPYLKKPLSYPVGKVSTLAIFRSHAEGR